MDQLNINKLLNRENEAQQIKNNLRNFELNKNNLLEKLIKNINLLIKNPLIQSRFF